MRCGINQWYKQVLSLAVFENGSVFVCHSARESNGLETAEIMVLQSLAHPSGLGNIIIIILLIVIST